MIKYIALFLAILRIINCYSNHPLDYMYDSYKFDSSLVFSDNTVRNIDLSIFKPDKALSDKLFNHVYTEAISFRDSLVSVPYTKILCNEYQYYIDILFLDQEINFIIIYEMLESTVVWSDILYSRELDFFDYYQSYISPDSIVVFLKYEICKLNSSSGSSVNAYCKLNCHSIDLSTRAYISKSRCNPLSISEYLTTNIIDEIIANENNIPVILNRINLSSIFVDSNNNTIIANDSLSDIIFNRNYFQNQLGVINMVDKDIAINRKVRMLFVSSYIDELNLIVRYIIAIELDTANIIFSHWFSVQRGERAINYIEKIIVDTNSINILGDHTNIWYNY
jgi:hypothetical protein